MQCCLQQDVHLTVMVQFAVYLWQPGVVGGMRWLVSGRAIGAPHVDIFKM
jgi:hypothetical protein